MIDLYKQIDFTKKGEQKDIEYEIFLKQAAKQIAQQESDNLRKIKKPQYDQQLQNHLIVTGIPVLKQQNQQKFLKVFQSFMDKKKIGQANGLLSIDVGMQNNIGNQTLYMIFKQSSQSKTAFKKLNNLKFDKDHTLTCFTVKQIHQAMKFNPQYKQPTLFTTSQLIQYNLNHEVMSQFVVRQGNDVMLRWLDHVDKSSKAVLENQYLRNDQIKISKIGFSYKGKYMVVCTDKGTYLYGGNDMKVKGFYPQEAPVDFKFSNDEKYMITFNGNDIKNKQNFIIWGVQQQIKLKSYRAFAGQNLDSFQFNSKSSLLAVALTHQIFIYSLKSIQQFKTQLKLSEQDSNMIKANHIQKISWLLDNKSLVCVCYQIDYNPNSMAATRVFIYDVENKVERKWRTWTEHAKKGEIVVSEKGDWVAVIMRKFLKRNHFSTVIQIGNLLKNDDPIEINSLEIKDNVGNVSWDFNSNRLAIIHEDQQTRRGINVKHVVQFYQIIVKGRKMDLSKIQQIKSILSNRVLLSSCGTFFCVYNISESSPQRGKISFGLFVKDKKDKRQLTTQWVKQNIMIHQLNFFKMDQSGRFVLLGTEKSYQIWNMAGEMLFKDTLIKTINNLEWRPREMKMLPEEQEEKLLSEEKDIRKKYQQLDVKKLDFLRYQKEQAKKLRRIEFLEYLNKKKQWTNKFNQKRKKILGFDQYDVKNAIYQVVTDIQVA